MFISHAVATAALAFSMMPTIYGFDSTTQWTVLQCEDQHVTRNGVDYGPYGSQWQADAQLTWAVCHYEYFGVGYWDLARSACVSIDGEIHGIEGDLWWSNCAAQAKKGWYDVDYTMGQQSINGKPYTSDFARGLGLVEAIKK